MNNKKETRSNAATSEQVMESPRYQAEGISNDKSINFSSISQAASNLDELLKFTANAVNALNGELDLAFKSIADLRQFLLELDMTINNTADYITAFSVEHSAEVYYD